MSKISIILLNWNNFPDTRECILSLKEISYRNYEIIVVDNGSEDGSTQKIQEEFPEWTYIYNKENLGFAGGTNVGIKYALDHGVDYVFFINNDMMVAKDFLDPLVRALELKDVGIAGPATYCYPKTEELYTAGRVINYWRGGAKELYLTGKTQEVNCLGGCFLIKREVIERIGLFYELYFLNFEEIEYCLNTKKAGFRIFCCPESKIWHKIRKTQNKIPLSSAYYSYRNKFLFVKRNAPFHIKYPFLVYYSIFLIIKSLKNLLKGEKKMALSILSALGDFWKGRKGKRVLFEKI